MNKMNVSSELEKFLDSVPKSFPFPMGGDTTIPTSFEEELLSSITAAMDAGCQEWPSVGNAIRGGYQSAVFAVRMAVYAARESDSRILEAGLYGLVFSNGQVDYRDLLKALSIIDDCCQRLNVELANVLPAHVDLNGMQDTIKGYLLRDAEMREIDVMGIHTEETPDGLVYKNRY